MRAQLGVLCVLLLGVSTFAAQESWPSTKPVQARVLVLPFDAVNSPQQSGWIVKGVQQSLLADLASLKPFVGVAEEIGTIDGNRALDAAASARAQFVVFGSYQLVGDQIRFTGQILDASGKVLGGIQTTGSMRDFFGAEDSVGHQVRDALTSAPVIQAVAAPAYPDADRIQPKPAATAAPTPRPLSPLGSEPHPVYAWDRDSETDFGTHARYNYYLSDYYNRRLSDNYQAYWNAYYYYNYIPGIGFPYYNNVTIIQPTNASPTNGSRPAGPIGNVPGGIINTIQGASPNTLQNLPPNNQQNPPPANYNR